MLCWFWFIERNWLKYLFPSKNIKQISVFFQTSKEFSLINIFERNILYFFLIHRKNFEKQSLFWYEIFCVFLQLPKEYGLISKRLCFCQSSKDSEPNHSFYMEIFCFWWFAERKFWTNNKLFGILWITIANPVVGYVIFPAVEYFNLVFPSHKSNFSVR